MEKKKKIIIAVVAAVLAIGVIVLIAINVNKKTGPKRLELTFSSNSGTPYSWKYEIEDTSIVQCTDRQSKELNPGADGGEVRIHYFFKGLKEGTTTIIFKYVNSIDENVEKEEKYIVVVDRDNNIHGKIAE